MHRMASQMLVPASKDTLFMRGFDIRRDIDEIRDYFSEECGRCSVEFFKESECKTKLYVALKFENRDIAKDLLEKYDNGDVLGDRITISWFKDLRRARMKANMGHRQRWSPDRGFRTKYQTQGRYMQRSYGGGNWGTRGRKFDRSSSRSRSPSSSRSRSRSRSPTPRRSRSRSRSREESHDRKHRRKRTSESKGRRSKDKRHRRDRSNSDTRESRERSRTPKADREVSEKRTVGIDKSMKSTVRSAVTTIDKKNDEPSDDESEGDMYGQPVSEDELTDQSDIQDTSHESPPPRHHRKPSPEPTKPPVVKTASKEAKSDIHHSPGQRFDSAHGPIERTPERPLESKSLPPVSEKATPERVPPVLNRYEKNRRSPSPVSRNHLPATRARGAPGGSEDDYEDSPPRSNDRDMYGGHRQNNRPDPRYGDDRAGDSGPVRARQMAAPDDIDHDPPRSKRPYDEEDTFEKKKMRDYDDTRAAPGGVRRPPGEEFDKRRGYSEMSTSANRESQYYDDRGRLEHPTGERRPLDRGPPPIERGFTPMDHGDHTVDRGPPTLERNQPLDRGPARGGHMDRERSPFLDDRGSTGSSLTRSGVQAFNGSITHEVEKGALGLPQDKITLVREKKDEIEKSYRQDCETFAAVTKMLISKDTWLEDRLQASLRENLKDIGQRCIHELREYVEELKTEMAPH